MRVEDPHGLSGAEGLIINNSYDGRADDGRSVASHFAELVDNKAVAPFNEYFDDTVIDLLKKQCRLMPGFSILDLACGNGKFLDRLRRDFDPKSGLMHGIDNSFEMVNIAKAKFPAITFEYGDIRNFLPKENNKYDLITCINAVHYLPNMNELKQAYATAYRLLKPGGHYIVVTGDEASTAGLRNISGDVLRQWIKDGRKPMNWSMPDASGKPVFRLNFYPYLNEEHQNALENAGFENVLTYQQYAPHEDIAQLNPEVYNLLLNEPIFIFLVARKPALKFDTDNTK